MLVGTPLCVIAGADAPVLVDARQLALDQVGQRQLIEEDVEEFVAREREDEVVQAFSVCCRPCRCPAAPAAACGRSTWSPLREAVVTGIDTFPGAAAAMAELRLLDVLARDADTFSPLSRSRTPRSPMASATALRIWPLKRLMKRSRLTELLFLLSNRRSTMRTVHIGVLLRSGDCVTTTCARADTTRTAGAPASRCSPW